jgi:carbonic anhydrase/acetyltransferase-like protein (isoleucine patch superfamily)/bifunctional DNA-binding transcriptional regulator/antitoxin component of YhaV-PrlF toxin-antitoxin module
MVNARLDDEGRLPLPPEVRAQLGWKPGQEVSIQVEGDQLLAQAATPATSLKDEARRLAQAMRGLTREAARQVADTVTALNEKIATPGGAAPAVAPFQGIAPRIAPGAYLAPGCAVLGDVSLGEEVSVWPGAVVRGDVAAVRVGARTNIQEGAVLHVSPQVPCSVGAGVTIGHQATVHACTIADDVLIGIHAVVLDGAKVGRHCVIAAGSVVPPGMEVPEGQMVMGVPGRVVRELTGAEIERIHWNADSYVSLKNQYLRSDPGPGAPPPGAPPRPEPPRRGTLPRYECRRAAGPITIDGSLDDPGWASVPPMSPLVLAGGGAPPVQPTEVKACWDETHLYVCFACKDTDIWGNLENRDDPLYDEEVVELFLCPTGDLRHYFELEISPNNVLFDAKVFSPEGSRAAMLVDREWNSPGIRTAVRVSGIVNDRTSPDIGWIVEAAVPFADLGLPGPPAPGSVWRANFYRIERGDVTEFTAWSPTYREPADFHVPDCFGELVFAA